VYGEISYAHTSGFYGSLDALSVGDVYVNNANTDRSESYVVSNFRAGIDLHVGPWAIAPFLGVNNLFDEEYAGNVRINAFGGRYFEPAPDRNLYVGVTLGYSFSDRP
jgi:iron complex outermembrane receptor protein